MHLRRIGLLAASAAWSASVATSATAHTAPPARCLTDCTPRIGIVSAFGAETDLLVAQTRSRRLYTINGKRFTTGVLRGNRVVIVLSGVSMINSTLVTQQMLDHFRVERLVMSGIAGGVDPANHVGDVTVPDRWAMPMEVFWNADSTLPSPCGKPNDVSCLGLQLATGADGQPLPPFDEKLGVKQQPRLLVGGRGVSATVFLANAQYRRYLFDVLQAQTFEMETAALAHVAHANGVPYIAFRSLSDLAGAEGFDADVGALFASGLAEANEALVTLAFLDAWAARSKRR